MRQALRASSIICNSWTKKSKQEGHAQQQGAGDLLSDAEGSVAYEEDEAAMPVVDLYSV
jgi:hypothetical protein